MAKAADKLFDPALVGMRDSGAQAGTGGGGAGQSGVQERMDFPCSVAQERFWLLDRLDPGNAAYNVAVRWRLEGRVLTDVLEQSWLKIIERHEILRSVFLEVDGAPIQRVMAHVKFRIQEIDLSNLALELQQTEGDRIGIIEARAPFDLASAPLIRATLLRFSPSVSIILVTTHQIVSDGWSIGVMAREMGVIYEALLHDKPIGLEPIPIQYADYSLWQLEWLRVRGTEAETTYWTRQLAGVKPFKVIADRTRSGAPSTQGAIVSRLLPRSLTNRAQKMSADRGATLFATVLAALCAMLARFTGETEVVIGTQVSDRDQVELEPMIGQFVNSLILRNHLDGNPRFEELVERVRDTVSQALEYRHIPIERLLGMVKGERSQANTPPISVNFIFQKTFIHNTSYADFALIDMPSLPAGAIYDLNFFMVERPDGWRFSCQYNTDQFEGATAERLLGYFQSLLESAVAGRDRRLSELTLSAPGEARLLLSRLNDTRALYPRDLTLAKLFEAQVARAPDAIALCCGERLVTYAELNASANRFAACLRKQGVTAGIRVGVCLHKSAALPICLLAILKVGAKCVPMDPADPPVRQAELAAATATTVIIGETSLAWAGVDDALPLIDVATALEYDAPGAEIAPAVVLESDATAFLEYTSSGSEAGGVAGISHRQLANLIYSLAKRPGVSDRDVIVASSPIAVDRMIGEIFLALLTGARLVIATDKDLANGRALLNLLQRTGATILYGGPAIWRSLLEVGWIGYPALKMLCRVAELGPKLVDRLSEMGGELWALYGHPETGIWSAVQRLKPKQGYIVVGEPIANTTLHVLDSTLQPAPIGATGELCVGGEGNTLLRTGDLARLRATGQIEFLGRGDDRFTHLGRRIDPAVIERVLLQLPQVAEAAVVYAHSGPEDGIITAYIVPRQPADERQALVAALRSRLADALPAYLIPGSLQIRDSLPHTPGGAVDRRSLQALRPAEGRGKPGGRPSGDIETRLADMWMSMLGLDSIDAGDNFFEMGGHSLLAARMLARVERTFGRRVRLATLFVAPTLREFAKILAQNELREFDFRQVVKIQPNGSKQPLIAINNTGIYYGLAKRLGPDQPVYSLQLFDPSVRTAALPDTLEEIAAGYVDLIRHVQPQGPYDLMGWCVAGALAFEIANQLTEQKQVVSHLFLIDSWVPGYLRRLPKLRGLIAAYSLRMQLILADLHRVLASEKSWWAFFSQRTTFKKLKLLAARSLGKGALKMTEEHFGPENYDEWLLAYLQKLTARYEPRPYPGTITLLRSREEPAGWFFKVDAGWGEFTRRKVEVMFVDGNHFTMFQDPGAGEMARHLVTALEGKSTTSGSSSG